MEIIYKFKQGKPQSIKIKKGWRSVSLSIDEVKKLLNELKQPYENK